MHRPLICPFIAAALACALPAFAGKPVMMPAPPPPLPTGIHAPAFTTKTLQGKPLSLRSLRGKVVLLDYWATWCIPCRVATPTMERLHRQFGRRGLAVVGISLDAADTLAQVKPFIKRYGITYTIAVSPQQNMAVANAYHAADVLPSQFLIDKKGIVRWCDAGYTLDEGRSLRRLIRRLLAEKA